MFSIRIAKSEQDMDNFFRMSFQTAKTVGDRMYKQMKEENPDKTEEELLQVFRKEAEEYFDFSAPDARVFMVEKNDGEYGGHIWVGIRNSEDAWDFQRPLWIYDIIVDPKFRGNGLGKMLLHRAEEFAIELKRNIGLFVHEHNMTAIGLYRSQDYYFKVVPMPKSVEETSIDTKSIDYDIRERTENGLESIKQLGLERFKQMVLLSKDVKDEQISDKYEEYFKKFDSADDQHQLFVATFDGEIAGFVWIGVADFSDKVGFFYDLAISENHKGKGLEEALLNYSEIWSKNRGLVSVYYLLHVRSDITEEFLKSQGYSVPGYFMEKELVRDLSEC